MIFELSGPGRTLERDEPLALTFSIRSLVVIVQPSSRISLVLDEANAVSTTNVCSFAHFGDCLKIEQPIF